MHDITLPWATLKFPDRWMLDYENEIWPHVTMPEGGTGIDIGAHYGFYTTKMAHDAGPAGRVLAFEPNSTNREILKNNLMRNQLSATIYDCALSDYDGKGKLFTYGQEGNDSGKHFLRGSDKNQVFDTEFHLGYPALKPQYDTDVRVTTLDKVADSIQRIDLIKMDVEGAELKVIDGALHTLKKTMPRLVIEVHFGLHQQLQEMLGKLGYIMVKSYPSVTYSSNPFAIFESRDPWL